jgi:exopolysaccharide biosynthesis polyprenyl glycosylphosphotransferase
MLFRSQLCRGLSIFRSFPPLQYSQAVPQHNLNVRNHMATSEYAAKLSKSECLPLAAGDKAKRRSTTQAAVTAAMMMATDVLAVLFALWLASILRFNFTYPAWFHISPSDLPVVTLPVEPGYLFFFLVSLLIVNRREGLYGPLQTHSLWHELRRTVQACFTAGLLLCGAMYVMRNTSISRTVVAYLLCLTTLFLVLLRSYWRYSLYRRYERGLDTRNVLIIGASRIGNVLCKQITLNRHLGRTFKGFVEIQEGQGGGDNDHFLVGSLRQMDRLVRQHFIDEIIIADRCSTSEVIELVETARELDVEVLVIPGFYEELTPDAPIEYLGNFPVVALHRRNVKAVAHLFKRFWDFAISGLLVIGLMPTLLVIALLIKLDSPGPILYTSDRVGKKGRVFPCYKFRTMVVNAEELKQSLAAQNERNGVLFKMRNDPRITRIGRVLRKYSLDELPQLLNVLHGDMSLVGPRPPVASEVQRYEIQHFRRLEVLPGLTGLWQVRARQDPSFEKYVGLDLTYVENWSFWLDLKILVRTAEVVLRGTGV